MRRAAAALARRGDEGGGEWRTPAAVLPSFREAMGRARPEGAREAGKPIAADGAEGGGTLIASPESMVVGSGLRSAAPE
jgi:hypothetical protein